MTFFVMNMNITSPFTFSLHTLYMYKINDAPMITPQTCSFSNLSIVFFNNLLFFRKDKAVPMNNLSLHLNDYEDKLKKKMLF